MSLRRAVNLAEMGEEGGERTNARRAVSCDEAAGAMYGGAP